jgi:alpha-galactosidase/6-phospho-beta-glucosidase family protein
MKLACIGASYKFVRNVVADLALGGGFDDLEVVVMDLDRRSLDIVVGACRTLIDVGHAPMKISGTLDRREAVDGADFVLTAIGVGGLALWEEETRFCLEHGFVHAIGDTIGPAALSKALRTVSVMLAIARDMEALCPAAWLINVTNPLSTAVKAVASLTKTKVIGLCDGSLGHLELIADVYGVERSRVSFDPVGVNHFAFTNRVMVDGREVTASLYEDAAKSKARSLDEWRLGREIFKLMGGWLPLVEDRHLTEFFPYYVSAVDGGRVRYGGGPLNLPERMKSRQRMEQDHVDLAAGKIRQGGLAAYRGEPLHDIISWLRGEGAGTHVVNVPNGEHCRDLRREAIVEITARLSRDSVVPVDIPGGTLPPHVVCILNTLSVIHDATVLAAVTGDRDKARQALLLDPFLQNRDIVTLVPELVEGIFRINRQYLPA